MKKLLVALLFLFAVPLCLGQGQNQGGTGTLNGTGAPTGACSPGQLYTDNSSGALYSCNAGTWLALVGGGTGTVTTFTVNGTTTPLFTKSVSNPTTTPNLAFTLSSFAADGIYINATGGSAIPTVVSLPDTGSSALGYTAHGFTTVAAGGNATYTGTTGTVPQGGSTSHVMIDSSPKLDNGATTANTLTYAGSGGVAAPQFNGTGTTPAAVSLSAGAGNILALPANSAGYAAPASGGTSYLRKLIATMTAGIPLYATPATNEGVLESAESIIAPSGTKCYPFIGSGGQGCDGGGSGGGFSWTYQTKATGYTFLNTDYSSTTSYGTETAFTGTISAGTYHLPATLPTNVGCALILNRSGSKILSIDNPNGLSVNGSTTTGVIATINPSITGLAGAAMSCSDGSAQLSLFVWQPLSIGNIYSVLDCADTSGSGTAQSCNTTPSFTPVAGSCIVYTSTSANSGAGLTVNVNSLGATSVAKWQTTTTLSANDLRANTQVQMCYDGTNWEMGPIGNAPSGSVSSVSGTTNQIDSTGGTTPVLSLDANFLDTTMPAGGGKTLTVNNGSSTGANSLTNEPCAATLNADDTIDKITFTAATNYFATVCKIKANTWVQNKRLRIWIGNEIVAGGTRPVGTASVGVCTAAPSGGPPATSCTGFTALTSSVTNTNLGGTSTTTLQNFYLNCWSQSAVGATANISCLSDQPTALFLVATNNAANAPYTTASIPTNGDLYIVVKVAIQTANSGTGSIMTMHATWDAP